MSEIADFALIILAVAGALALAVGATKLADVVPVPAPAFFLVGAAVLSTLWPGLRADLSAQAVERLAVVALVVILLNGGMDIGWQRMRASLGPVLSLGVLGTFMTAGIVAVAAHVLLGYDWTIAGIIGAAVAPTDPAVVFSVLGRREIEGRAGTTLEGEAGVNDPAGIALMIGLIELATHPDATFLVVVEDFAVEMAVGAAVGLVAGRLLVTAVPRLRLGSAGLYPIFVLVVAAVVYGAASLADGSGFLAVFVAGLLLGDAITPFKAEIVRFHGALASLAEMVVFLALGLTVSLTGIAGEVWWHGAVLLLVTALVARPLTVLATLARARLSWAERGFIAWSGLKGAVPILLAAFAVIAGVADARTVYGLVFVVVLVSVTGQGSLVPFVARRLAVPMREQPVLPWELSVGLSHPPENALVLEVRAGSDAEGRALGDIADWPEAGWVRMVVRNGRAMRPHARLELKAGDQLHLFADEDGRDQLAALVA